MTSSSTLLQRWRGWVDLQRSRFATEHWRVGIIDAPVHTLLEPGPLPPIQWVTPVESAGYWADPFGLPGDDSQVYAERFDEDTGLGRIERLTLRGRRLVPVDADADAYADAQAAPACLPIGRGLHASFPHAFESDGQRYGVAETGAARECLLYRIDESGCWHSPITLLSDVAAADPAIFRHGGLFWLAYTDVDRGVHDNLCLRYATRLDGPWTPHPGNPVKVDRGGARMAGPFFEHEGVLYRPGQDCSRVYGGAVVIYRVDECTAQAYRETLVKVLSPDPGGPLPDGLHTLSGWGERTLVDGKRMVVNPRTVARRLVARLGRSSGARLIARIAAW